MDELVEGALAHAQDAFSAGPLALRRSRALVHQALFAREDPSLCLDGYRIVRCLGAGGHGVVYEARERDTALPWALKTIRNPCANAPSLLQEFRALADLQHPNLIALGELREHASETFFTMELLDGRDFVSGVTAETLRGALIQLLSGLAHLHRAGRVHGDLKPSNVMITREGRVVLLDFGLALHRGSGLAGTPGYVEPERAEHGVTAASDLYALGMMLQHVQHEDAQLHELAARWRSSLAGARPSADETLALLASRQPAQVEHAHFVGRGSALAQLHDALVRAREATTIIAVEGAAGIGKTALVSRFTAQLDAHALVLRGRCFERESLPYKGIDQIFEHVRPMLDGLDSAHALARIFPAADGPRAEDTTRELAQLRRQAYLELGTLFARLTAQQQVVLVIDDLQWGDAEGARLLAALCETGLRNLLVVAIARTRSAPLWQVCVPHERLQLGPLDSEESVALARALLPPRHESELGSVAIASGGHPLFAAALAGRVRAGEALAATFEQTVADSLGQLSELERSLLGLMSIAGGELARTHLLQALGAGTAASGALDRLRRERWLSASSGSTSATFEFCHDQQREVVVASLDAAQRRLAHRALLDVLTRDEATDPETLLEHSLNGGVLTGALELATRAAQRALERLAFERAARLYERALALGPAPAVERHLRVRLADALANSGRCAAAALQCEALARDADSSAEAAALLARAADHAIFEGDAEYAERLLRRAAERVQLGWPTHEPHVWLSRTLSSVWAVRTRGTPARDELLWSASHIMVHASLPATAHFALVLALAPRDCTELPDAARGLWACMQAPDALVRFGQRTLLRARDSAESKREQHRIAQLDTAIATAALACGDFTGAIQSARHAQRMQGAYASPPSDRFLSLSVELMARIERGEMREVDKRWSEYAHDARSRSELMGELWTRSHPARLSARDYLADDCAAIEDTLAAQRDALRRMPKLGSLMTMHASSSVGYALYSEDALGAWAQLRTHWPRLHMHDVVTRSHALTMRAGSALMRAGQLPAGSLARRVWLRRARRAAHRLEAQNRNYARASAACAHALAAQLDGDLERSRHWHERACVLAEDAHRPLHAAAARRALGLLVGGQQGADWVDEAERALRARGVSQPARWSRWSLHGGRM